MPNKATDRRQLLLKQNKTGIKNDTKTFNTNKGKGLPKAGCSTAGRVNPMSSLQLAEANAEPDETKSRVKKPVEANKEPVLSAAEKTIRVE